jgi:MFS family permease
MKGNTHVLFVLAVTQITGWGAVGVLPVLARHVATEFEATLPSVFVGTSLMFVSMALAAPLAGRAFRRFTTRKVMAAGASLIGLGLCLLAFVPSLLVFWVVWAMIGIAGAMFLTTAAYAWLAEYADHRARSLIGTLMLVTGLAGSVFWPITAFLEQLFGWRSAVLIFGGIMILVGPIVRFGLPPTTTQVSAPTPNGAGRRGGVFTLLVAAIALNSFVTFGVEAVGIELLQAMGAELAGAVAIASLLGVAKVGGRVIDLLGGQRWDGMSTGLVSGAMIPTGLAVLWVGGVSSIGVGGFLVLFGIGSGAFAVARATMPLVFYSKADYAAAMSIIALPMNLINALAPPVLAALLTEIGVQAVFILLAGLSVLALIALLLLRAKRIISPKAE